jgi:DNA-binding transcriptional ArsR family regulator
VPPDFADNRLAAIAGAIAEPARTRMLCCLMDGRARTSTELAVVAQVSPSTASVHLAKLKEQHLVVLLAQGKHRYYSLAGAHVAEALEALMRVAGVPATTFVPSTPERLRLARTCYDHMAGTIAVAMHDFMLRNAWLDGGEGSGTAYALGAAGQAAFAELGVAPEALRKSRRRFACACVDWSERRPHLGGALGAGLLAMLLRDGWVERDLDSRALAVTRAGQRHFKRVFQIGA